MTVVDALLVAVGAALGAPARYLTNHWVRERLGGTAVAGTLLVNVVGSFVLGLLGAAVLLVAGGLYLVSRLSDMFANPQGSAQYDYITLQALTIAAPMLIVLGVATGIGVLFIYAVRWKRA